VPYCTVQQAQACNGGRAKYFALRSGGLRGVYPSREELVAAVGGHEGAVWKTFSSRPKAVQFCFDDALDLRPLIIPARVRRIVMKARSSKANTEGNVRWVCVTRQPSQQDGSTDAETQLLEDLVAFLGVAGFQESDQDVPFFSRLGPSLEFKRLNRYMVSKALKDAAVQFGFDPKYFSSHCHRIGAASVLSEEGFTDEEIKKYGGWSGDSHKLYELNFSKRPSTLRIAQQGGGVAMNDIRTLVPSHWAPL